MVNYLDIYNLLIVGKNALESEPSVGVEFSSHPYLLVNDFYDTL